MLYSSSYFLFYSFLIKKSAPKGSQIFNRGFLLQKKQNKLRKFSFLVFFFFFFFFHSLKTRKNERKKERERVCVCVAVEAGFKDSFGTGSELNDITQHCQT
ncbi:unnamed protein product [Rhizopus stolonifer]